MFRAAVFDLDGTLVDSLDDIANALDAALADEGLPPANRADVASWVGDGARQLVVRAVTALGGDLERMVKHFGEHYRAAPVSSTRVFDGIPAVLDALDARGVLLAVLSNKPHDLTVKVVDRLLGGRFAAVHGQRPGGALKPSPEAGIMIADELGVAPGSCALIGDTAIDVAAARAAGMTAIAVSWGLRPRADLLAASPDHLVDTPDALLQVLL